jgi:hypothetical protein
MAKSWSPTEWSLFLESQPRPASLEKCAEIDRRFGFGKSTNDEVLVSWLSLAARSGYPPALPRTEEVLGRVGRMKYLKPLYTALASNAATQALARRCFERFKDGYHPVARQMVAGVLNKQGA